MKKTAAAAANDKVFLLLFILFYVLCKVNNGKTCISIHHKFQTIISLGFIVCLCVFEIQNKDQQYL